MHDRWRCSLIWGCGAQIQILSILSIDIKKFYVIRSFAFFIKCNINENANDRLNSYYERVKTVQKTICVVFSFSGKKIKGDVFMKSILEELKVKSSFEKITEE